jgi:hypothetical protein
MKNFMNKQFIYPSLILISFISLLGIYVYLNQQTRNTVTNKDSFETFNNSVQSQDECIDAIGYILKGEWIYKDLHGDDEVVITLSTDGSFTIRDSSFQGEFKGDWIYDVNNKLITFNYQEGDLERLFKLIKANFYTNSTSVADVNYEKNSASFNLSYEVNGTFETTCQKGLYNINYISMFAYKQS